MPDKTPFDCREHLHPHHTHSDENNLELSPIHLRCAALGCGRKPESSEKTQADLGRNSTQTVALLGINFFPSFTLKQNIIRGLKEELMVLNKATLECAL